MISNFKIDFECFDKALDAKDDKKILKKLNKCKEMVMDNV